MFTTETVYARRAPTVVEITRALQKLTLFVSYEGMSGRLKEAVYNDYLEAFMAENDALGRL